MIHDVWPVLDCPICEGKTEIELKEFQNTAGIRYALKCEHGRVDVLVPDQFNSGFCASPKDAIEDWNYKVLEYYQQKHKEEVAELNDVMFSMMDVLSLESEARASSHKTISTLAMAIRYGARQYVKHIGIDIDKESAKTEEILKAWQEAAEKRISKLFGENESGEPR